MATQRGPEEFARDMMAGGAAVFGGFAATGFAEAQDGAAVDGKVLFALARVLESRMGNAERRMCGV